MFHIRQRKQKEEFFFDVFLYLGFIQWSVLIHHIISLLMVKRTMETNKQTTNHDSLIDFIFNLSKAFMT